MPVGRQFVLKCPNNESKQKLHLDDPHKYKQVCLRVVEMILNNIRTRITNVSFRIFPLRRFTNFLHVLDTFVGSLDSFRRGVNKSLTNNLSKKSKKFRPQNDKNVNIFSMQFTYAHV